MKSVTAWAAAVVLLGGLACAPVLAAPAEPEPVPAPAPEPAPDADSLEKTIEILKVKLDVLEKKLQALKDMESAKSQGTRDEYKVVLQSLDAMYSLLEGQLARV